MSSTLVTCLETSSTAVAADLKAPSSIVEAAVDVDIDNGIDILDIRQSSDPLDLKSAIIDGLQRHPDELELPSILCWSEAGAALYDKLCHDPTYYPRHCEVEILQRHADSIANTIPDSAVLIELGCGNLQKTGAILSALAAQKKQVAYHALDVSAESLHASLRGLHRSDTIPSETPSISVSGLLGTYEDCIRWLNTEKNPLLDGSSKISEIAFLWMGNTIANTELEDATTLLTSFRESVYSKVNWTSARPKCSFVFGADACADEDRIDAAYLSNEGFFAVPASGMEAANRVLRGDCGGGRVGFQLQDWEVKARFDRKTRMVRASHIALRNTRIELGLDESMPIKQGTEIRQLLSGKWSADQVAEMAREAGFGVASCWMDGEGIYGMQPILVLSLPIDFREGFYRIVAVDDVGEI
ncbi:histidine-specific methyltransferase [Aspergillus multicolor]|uniref:histidine-specific methyltransferase n=1 Tax=Aspergillus multicolor TaxID=41759 RepID=UPI003CCDD1D1